MSDPRYWAERARQILLRAARDQAETEAILEAQRAGATPAEVALAAWGRRCEACECRPEVAVEIEDGAGATWLCSRCYRGATPRLGGDQ